MPQPRGSYAKNLAQLAPCLQPVESLGLLSRHSAGLEEVKHKHLAGNNKGLSLLATVPG